MRLLKTAATALLWTAVVLCLAATVVPHYLDRIYYRGPASPHFDGARFFNPSDADERMPPIGGMVARRLLRDRDRPEWPDQVAVHPAKPPARVEGSAMLATWIGHATLLVQTQGINILTDPVWSRHAGPFGIGPARVAEPGVRFEDLPRIQLVLVSHDHYDHLDLATLRRLWERDRPLIVTSLGNDSVIRQAGVPSHALDWGGRIEVEPGIAVTVTRNHHWSSRWLADRNRALWSSFTVELPGGNFFFAGDTGWGDGKWPAEAAALGPVRLAAIPIGAFRFQAGQMASGSHIGPREAIRVWDALGRPSAIPIHWGTFRLSREAYHTPPKLLAAMMACAVTRGFAAVAIGRTMRVPPIGEAPPAPDMASVEACGRAGRFDAMR